jgi:hypothetical protein
MYTTSPPFVHLKPKTLCLRETWIVNIISSKNQIRLNILCLILVHKQIYQYIKMFEYKIYIYEKLGFGNLNTM